MTKGIKITQNGAEIPIFWLHYSAKPDRDAEWVAAQKRLYKGSESMWNQEQEMDFSAAGGERVLKELLERRWKDIVITDPEWQADPLWDYGNGLDYGKTHPCALVACAMDFDGTRYALSEHFRSGLTPAQHVPEMKKLLLPLNENGIPQVAVIKARHTVADQSMGYKNVAQENSFTSYIELFEKAGMPNVVQGQRGMDLRFVDEIYDAWMSDPVRFKIVCRNMPFPVEPGHMKKREGTWSNGCPNLLWELLGLRRKEQSPSRMEQVGESEGLVDKDNDASDGLKYWWFSVKVAPEQSKEAQWRMKAAEIKKRTPTIDLQSMRIHHARFEKAHAAKANPSWR